MTKQIKHLQVAVSGYDAAAYFDGQAIAGRRQVVDKYLFPSTVQRR